jgi:hypothetical protein
LQVPVIGIAAAFEKILSFQSGRRNSHVDATHVNRPPPIVNRPATLAAALDDPAEPEPSPSPAAVSRMPAMVMASGECLL